MTRLAQAQAQDHPAAAKAAQLARDFPVREYIISMTDQLAEMARGEGDERLAQALEAAAIVGRATATSGR